MASNQGRAIAEQRSGSDCQHHTADNPVAKSSALADRNLQDQQASGLNPGLSRDAI